MSLPVEKLLTKVCTAGLLFLPNVMFDSEGDVRGQRDKRGSRGRGKKGSDDDSPKKKKMKIRYCWFRKALRVVMLSL